MMGTVVHDLWKLAAKMPDDPTLRAMIENGAREFEELQADVARLKAYAKTVSEFVNQLHQENCNLRTALEPFANFADPINRVPGDFRITSGSHFARRQLLMSDCYNARKALAE